jgi:hypothetical protein
MFLHLSPCARSCTRKCESKAVGWPDEGRQVYISWLEAMVRILPRSTSVVLSSLASFMSAFAFLDLPVELAKQILLSADVPTVLRVVQARLSVSLPSTSRRRLPICLQTAHLMHAFVCDSEEIQYKIQLYFHGYVDTPQTRTSSYAERGTQLNMFRRRWVVTESTQNRRLYLSSTFYVLEGGVFAMLGRSSNRFFITRNHGPSRGIRPLSWRTPSLDFKIITFGIDPTVNLLAVFGIAEKCVDRSPSMQSRPLTCILNRDKKWLAEIRLLTLTDCTPCPLAASPMLRYPGFPDCKHIQDSWSRILISGSWLGLTWREVLDSKWERLSIWNWKLGSVCLVRRCLTSFENCS